MQIEIQSRGFALTPGLHGHILQRISRSMQCIRDDIRKVAIRLSDDNGPRHGNDKRCLVRVALHGRKEVVIRDIHGDMYSAITNAAMRAAHAVKKLLRQRRERRGRAEKFVAADDDAH
jgi:putative sigma-54 modulation protein